MSLDIKKLQNVKRLGGGKIEARCPACAEIGHDKKGNHLCILPSGKFGCVKHPKDHEHNSRIHALAGEARKPFNRNFKLRVVTAQPSRPLQSVRASLTDFRGTLGTGKVESQNDGDNKVGTLGTPISESLHMEKKRHIETSAKLI